MSIFLLRYFPLIQIFDRLLMRGKKEGANLMVDKALIGRICDYANLKKTDRVLEIGAGTGNLTVELSKRAGIVYAVEKDTCIFQVLSKRLSGTGNVELLCGDALKIELPEHDKVVSNMPYEISRKGVERLLAGNFGLAVLVYQKEYAEKLAAIPGGDNYRFISALAQSCSDIEVLEDIPPKAFDPSPPVCSAVVRMRQRTVPAKEFIHFLHRLFDHRNKRIGGLFKGKEMGHYADRRGYELSADELRAAYSLSLL
jgi:16S rRNA (adenine1518-N6/adenine1519-N6)-dimethyltransferase